MIRVSAKRLFPALLGLCVQALPAPGTAADPLLGTELPRGSIIAFLPDFQSGAYRDLDSLRGWLRAQGWAICDGAHGTPDLHHRYLFGTAHPADAGQSLGSVEHNHEIRLRSGPQQGRDRASPSGNQFTVRDTSENHVHAVDGQSAAAPNQPPSVRVLFIMRTR